MWGGRERDDRDRQTQKGRQTDEEKHRDGEKATGRVGRGKKNNIKIGVHTVSPMFVRCPDEWMNECNDKWMNDCNDERMNECNDE